MIKNVAALLRSGFRLPRPSRWVAHGKSFSTLFCALLFTCLSALLVPAHGVTLAWDPNPENDLAGYRLYYRTGTSTQVLDVGKTTTVTLSNLTPGATYYFDIRAYNTSEAEAPPSSVVTYTVPAPPVATATPGKYTGLIKPSVGNQQGLFTMTVASTGVTSGRVTLGSRNYTWSSRRFVNGVLSIIFRRNGQSSLTLTLRLTSVPGKVTGTITDGVFTSTLTAEVPGSSSVAAKAAPEGETGEGETQPGIVPQPGKFTVALAPGDESAPQGYGYAVLTVLASGSATTVGTLADGTKFSYTAAIGQSGQYPIYLPLYQNTGYLIGEITFRDLDGESDADGSLAWSSSSATSPVSLRAARYQQQPGTPVLAGLSETGGRLSLSISSDEFGDLVSKAPFGFTPDYKKFKALGANPQKIVLNLSVTTGLFSGSFSHGGSTLPIRGVLYQKGAGHGIGWFSSATQSGKLELAPEL